MPEGGGRSAWPPNPMGLLRPLAGGTVNCGLSLGLAQNRRQEVTGAAPGDLSDVQPTRLEGQGHKEMTPPAPFEG